MPDGSTAAYRQNDPRLDAALQQGGTPFKTSVEGSAEDVFSPTTKTAADELQQTLLNTNENLARIENAADMFDPDYLTYLSKIEQIVLKTAEKAGVDVGEEGREKITKVSKFMRNSIENLNLYIKEITGRTDVRSQRQTGYVRQYRTLKMIARPSFKAKMDDAIAQLKKKQARHAYALENGINPESLFGQETGPWSQAATTPEATPEASTGTGYEQMSDEDFAKSYL